MILLEDAELELLGDLDRALIRLLLSRDDLQQRRLAGSVGADEGVTFAWIEPHRDVLEEDLGAEALGELFEGDHRTRPPSTARARHQGNMGGRVPLPYAFGELGRPRSEKAGKCSPK